METLALNCVICTRNITDQRILHTGTKICCECIYNLNSDIYRITFNVHNEDSVYTSLEVSENESENESEDELEEMQGIPWRMIMEDENDDGLPYSSRLNENTSAAEFDMHVTDTHESIHLIRENPSVEEIKDDDIVDHASINTREKEVTDEEINLGNHERHLRRANG